MTDILILAGTTEGRELADAIGRRPVTGNRFFVCVATEYGKQLLPEEREDLEILSQRLTEGQMGQLIDRHGISMLIDATHPYAQVVSQNGKEICEEKNISYLRLLRKEEDIPQDAIVVQDSREAVSCLSRQEGKALLTIGSKELAVFTQLPGFEDRLYPRILPQPEMTSQAFSLGFDAGHLICMQGPFSFEMNLAMLEQTGVSWLVTKESGKEGGFREKAEAAKAAGVKLIVISRPSREKGISLRQAMDLCGLKNQEESKTKEKADWFPLFTSLKDKNILVVGGGNIAKRRIKTLLDFSCKLTVIAKEADDWICQTEGLHLLERSYAHSDLEGMDFVLAATNDSPLNRQIGQACKGRGIPVNVADCKEDCDFYFPGIVKQGDLIVGLTAGGKNHDLAAWGKRIVEKAVKGETP